MRPFYPRYLFVLAILTLTFGHQAASAKTQPRATSVPVAAEDVILQWNRVTGQTIQIPGQQPGNINPVRTLAMVHLAMFDAVNSIDGSYTPYLTDMPGPRGAA